MAESSPAVERAESAARNCAAQRDDSIRLADWLLGLLREEWGRAAELVGSLGVDLETILAELEGSAESSPVAPAPSRSRAAPSSDLRWRRAEPAAGADHQFQRTG